MTKKQIIGAGLAGLITACQIKDAPLLEAFSKSEGHKALLRFRDQSVSAITGIPFEEVVVHKEIFFKGNVHSTCFSNMANAYSRKVTGTYSGRSIWDLNTVKRYVAPPDFYDQLTYRHQDRILWSAPVKEIRKSADGHGAIQTINTAPLPVIMKLCGMAPIESEFSHSGIHVDRYKLPKGSKVYQTIYFPDPTRRIFRASITGDLLIVESMNGQPHDEFAWDLSGNGGLDEVFMAFGIDGDAVTHLDAIDQKYGKIMEIPRQQREAILYELTRDFGVFSIGRFATWRNILLDDIAKDISVVERLMAASEYGRGLVLSSRK